MPAGALHDPRMTFEALEPLADFRHCFLLRHPGVDVDTDRTEAVRRLTPWHHAEIRHLRFDPGKLRLAEQVHGAGVAVVDETTPAQALPGMDGLVTRTPGLLLGIHVADCAAVYFADPVTGACGLVHSGKKGSELGISTVALDLMRKRFGCRVADVRAQVSPCIRPPAYEVDFAAEIRRQCLAAGVLPEHFHDSGVCTSSDLRRYYSYRMEKGRTGRMLALLGKPTDA